MLLEKCTASVTLCDVQLKHELLYKLYKLYFTSGLWNYDINFYHYSIPNFSWNPFIMLNFILLCLWIYHYSPFTSKSLNTLAIYKSSTHSIASLSVSWSLTSFKPLTCTASSTVLEIEMSLFRYFSHLFIILAILLF